MLDGLSTRCGAHRAGVAATALPLSGALADPAIARESAREFDIALERRSVGSAGRSRALLSTIRFAFAALAIAVVASGFCDSAAADTAWREVGERGRPQDARRTIDIVMRDNAFEPQQIQVRAGETVRFRIRNQGELLHEFNIGTPAMHAGHQREMAAMMEAGHLTATSMMQAHGGAHGSPGVSAGMAHDDPNSLVLEPGKRGELVWKFTRATMIEFACNVPGHYESGMLGLVLFSR